MFSHINPNRPTDVASSSGSHQLNKSQITPKISVEVLNKVRNLASDLQSHHEEISDLHREIAALTKEKNALSTRIPLEEQDNLKALKATQQGLNKDLNSLIEKKNQYEKIIASLANQVKTEEKAIGAKSSAMQKLAEQKNRAEVQGQQMQQDLYAKLAQTKTTKTTKERAKSEIKIYDEAKHTASENIKNSTKLLSRSLQKHTDLIKDALVQDVVDEFDKTMRLDLSPFLESDAKKNIALLANYIATFNLWEKHANSMQQPPGLGSAAVMATAAFILHALQDKNAQTTPGSITKIMAQALFATMILVLSKRAYQTNKVFQDVKHLKVERLMPNKKSNTDESNYSVGLSTSLGETKGIIKKMVERNPFYKGHYYPRLANLFITTVSHSVTHTIVSALQADIEKNLVHLLNAKAFSENSTGDELEDNAALFDQVFQLDTEKIKKIAFDAIDMIKQRKQNSTGEKKRYLHELVTFIEKEQSYVVSHLQGLVHEFTRETFLNIASNPDLNERIQEIKDEQEKQTSLDKEIKRIQSRSTPMTSAQGEFSGQGIDFNKSRIESLQKRYINLKNKSDTHVEKYRKSLTEYRQAFTEYSQLEEEIEIQKNLLAETSVSLKQEERILMDKKAQAKMPAEALGDQIAQINATIKKLTSEDKTALQRVKADPNVKKLVSPYALNRAIQEHLGKMPDQLEAHKTEYGYGSSFLSLKALLESIVNAHESFCNYLDAAPASEPISYSRLYADCGKKIAYGISHYSSKLISTGVVYDIDEKNGKITHIHPFIPRLSEALNETLQTRGNVPVASSIAPASSVA